MNNRERFTAVARATGFDYVPLFGFPWAPGVSWGLWEPDRLRLVEEGMPAWVGATDPDGREPDEDFYSMYLRTRGYESWMRYWGTTGPSRLDFFPAEPAKGVRTTRRLEAGFEIVESETGAVTRQVLDNDTTYSMPEFIEFDVRDRQSWYRYRDLVTPGAKWDAVRIEQACTAYDVRETPLDISAGGTWGGFLRGVMGPERAMTILYDDPGLAHEMLEWNFERTRKHIIPLVERLRPEIVALGEDLCYNHGMLISPAHFEEFCAPFYREVSALCRDCGVDVLAVDSDGNVMEFVDVAARCGVNALYPFEVKAGNDLSAIRNRHEHFVMFGGLEKEVLNRGNTHLIHDEIMGKVPGLLRGGRYFPNADHGIQPLVTFENLCMFMTLVHDACGNPEGGFPRMRP